MNNKITTWENVKLEVLVLSARHCCVCHRYAGLKIEVHHIQPRSEGGEDSLDNAIALCFDCHTDAGHYNTKHPRGSKFSSKELKFARERWYEIVKSNNISIPANLSEHLHFRHIVLQSVSIAKDLMNGNISKLPIDNALIIKNDVFESIRKNLSKVDDYYSYGIDYCTYPNISKVLEKYPDIQKVNRSDIDFSYFEFIRIPTKKELLSKRDELNHIIIQLIDNNVPLELFVRSLIYESHGCGDGYDDLYIERFEFRDLWFSFLSIENSSRDTIILSELNSSTRENTLSSYYERNGEYKQSFKFPKAPIKPGETVLFSTGTIACPFGYEYREETEIKRKPEDCYKIPYTLLKHSQANHNSKDYLLFGKYVRPDLLKYNIYGQKYSCDIHELDPTNLYTINEYWDCGSCPHYFIQKKDGLWYYVKELFAEESDFDKLETFFINEDVLKIRIVELENETTYISYIKCNDKFVHFDLEMNKGDFFELAVKECDIIEVFGHYIKCFENIPKAEQHIFRNRLIGEYLSKVNLKREYKITI